MNIDETRAVILRMRTKIEAELPKAKDPAEEVFAEIVRDGLLLIGELLVDIKRIADAAGEHHYHVPPGYRLVREGSVMLVEPIKP